ncbi:MAG TPA: hypothetical protein P5341_15735 [Hyphomonas sp.]|nr:hypothetical protein [Hyphomonas sp.]
MPPSRPAPVTTIMRTSMTMITVMGIHTHMARITITVTRTLPT